LKDFADFTVGFEIRRSYRIILTLLVDIKLPLEQFFDDPSASRAARSAVFSSSSYWEGMAILFFATSSMGSLKMPYRLFRQSLFTEG
jgi:hypothetical protein